MSVEPHVLSQSVALDGLPEDLAVDLIKVARNRPVKAGTALFEAGDPGDGFYALLEGSLRVVLRGEEGERAGGPGRRQRVVVSRERERFIKYRTSK